MAFLRGAAVSSLIQNILLPGETSHMQTASKTPGKKCIQSMDFGHLKPLRSGYSDPLGMGFGFLGFGVYGSYLKAQGTYSKSVISRVITRVTPFRASRTLLITHLLSPWAS